MWSKGAVVVIKRGDAAMSDAMEKSLGVKGDENLARDIGIMRVSHAAKIKKAMDESRTKYNKPRRPTPKPLLYLQIGYAMAVCGIEAVLNWIVRPPKRCRKRRANSRKKQAA